MKVIAVWPDDSLNTKIFLDGMQKKGHEIVYWVGEFSDKNGLTPPGAVFHGHYDAWEGKPAPPVLDILAPADRSQEEILGVYKQGAAVVLPMVRAN